MEIYKSMWIQKGIIIIALFFYVAVGLSFTANIPVSNPTEIAARQYIAELAGEITDDTFARINTIEAELDRTIPEYEDAKLAIENGGDCLQSVERVRLQCRNCLYQQRCNQSGARQS